MNLHTILTEPDQTYFITDPELTGQFNSLGHLKMSTICPHKQTVLPAEAMCKASTNAP